MKKGLDMRKVTGRVVETLTIYKDVEAEVEDDAGEDDIEQALRDKAYEKIITDEDSGWELDETLEVDVQLDDALEAEFRAKDDEFRANEGGSRDMAHGPTEVE